MAHVYVSRARKDVTITNLKIEAHQLDSIVDLALNVSFFCVVLLNVRKMSFHSLNSTFLV